MDFKDHKVKVILNLNKITFDQHKIQFSCLA